MSHTRNVISAADCIHLKLIVNANPKNTTNVHVAETKAVNSATTERYEMNEPKCIQCGRIKAVTMVPGSTEAYCSHCRIRFDTHDDGDIGRGSPERNAMNKEEYEIRQKHRR